MECYLVTLVISIILTDVVVIRSDEVSWDIKTKHNMLRMKSDKPTCSSNPEEEMTTIDLIKKTGYPAEEHFVITQDGYILALHRIPGPEGSPAVLLHHALLESSFCWVVSGKERGLAYILANNGYDVWMANVRGNTYSKNHTTLSTSDPAFWDFSWHEMGIYDLTAEIEYITSLKNDRIMYVGHSMGTTIFFAMASERPDVASKVKAMFGLAPAVYVDHLTGLFRIVEPIFRMIQENINIQVKSEFFGQNEVFRFAAKCICNRPVIREICQNFIFAAVGYPPEQFNATILPVILTHTPAGTSLKTIYHFAQGIRTKKFQYYDYGPEANLKTYKNEEPPEYAISNISVPIGLFWGENDYLSQPKDVMRLYEELPRKIELYRVDDSKFNHLDFIWGNDAPKLVYARLLFLMEKYL